MIILQLPGGVYSVYRKEVVNPNCISNASFQYLKQSSPFQTFHKTEHTFPTTAYNVLYEMHKCYQLHFSINNYDEYRIIRAILQFGWLRRCKKLHLLHEKTAGFLLPSRKRDYNLKSI